MGKVPVIRQTAWISLIPQLALMLSLILIADLVADVRRVDAIVIGTAIFLLYSNVTRRITTRAHREGMRRTRAGDFTGAITSFERSYDFFSRHTWIDRYRYLVLISSSAISYREMALVNIAYCYGQLGDGESCRNYYERALAEHPGSLIAQPALAMIEAIEKRS